MSVKTAKIFQYGRSQAVRLPNELRLPGHRSARSPGRALLLDRGAVGRGSPSSMNTFEEQPPMPPDRKIFLRMIFLDTNAVTAVLTNPISPVRRRMDATIGRGGSRFLPSSCLNSATARQRARNASVSPRRRDRAAAARDRKQWEVRACAGLKFEDWTISA